MANVLKRVGYSLWFANPQNIRAATHSYRRFFPSLPFSSINRAESSGGTTGSSPRRETLHIFDGTSLLYTSYFGKECTMLKKDKSMSNEARAYFDKLIYEHDKKHASHSIESHLATETSRGQSISSNQGDIFDSSVSGQAEGASSKALHVMSLNFLRYVQEHNPKNVVVAFDHGKRNFRHSLYPDYKQNRKSSPEGLLYQLLAAPLVFHSLGVKCFRLENYEADDVMASIGRFAREHLDMDIVYVSPDKDMYQLVTDPSIKIFQPSSKREITFENLSKVAGVPADRFCDFQSLSGDTADNIPGVKSVGPKTASALLAHYESLEELYADIDVAKSGNGVPSARFRQALAGVRCSPEKILANLLATPIDTLLLYRALVTLSKDLTLFNHAEPSAICNQDFDDLRNSVGNLDFDAILRQTFNHSFSNKSAVPTDFFRLALDRLTSSTMPSAILDSLGLDAEQLQVYINKFKSR